MRKKTTWRPLPDFLTIKDSKIEGLGVFTTRDLPKGFDLGISHIFDERFPDGYIRLPLGGFINHHEIPNCKAMNRSFSRSRQMEKIVWLKKYLK